MSRIKLIALGLLLVIVLGSAIGVVRERHQSRVLFVQLTDLQARRDALNIDFGRLEIEHATWAEPSRVERVARKQLGMIDPPADAIRLLRR